MTAISEGGGGGGGGEGWFFFFFSLPANERITEK